MEETERDRAHPPAPRPHPNASKALILLEFSASRAVRRRMHKQIFPKYFPPPVAVRVGFGPTEVIRRRSQKGGQLAPACMPSYSSSSSANCSRPSRWSDDGNAQLAEVLYW